MPDDFDPNGRIALVTGANKGIGYATAAGLAKLGMTVLLGARNEERGKGAAAALQAEGLDVSPLLIDVSDDGSVTRAAADIEQRHGKLDVLVSNAAVKLEWHPSPPSQQSLDMVRETFETNVFGTIRVLLATIPLLRRSDAPRIVTVSSGLGSLTWATTEGTAYMTHPLLSYPPSKAALNSVTVQFANELRDTPFKINVADPGYTDTDMTTNDTGSTSRTPERASQVIIRLATLPSDGPTAGYFDSRGEVPW